MIIPMHKYNFDIIENKIIINIKNINLKSSDLISLKVENMLFNIEKDMQLIENRDGSYQAKISIPENLDIKNKSVKLLIDKKASLIDKMHSKSKIVLELIYTPNILKNYSNFWLHRVTNGETLSDISKKYFGDNSLSNKIYESNIDRIDNTNDIKEGQILRIPRD